MVPIDTGIIVDNRAHKELSLEKNRFAELDIEADYCQVALDEDPEGAIVAALTRKDYACVVIGGGIRTHEPLLGLFEKVINRVRQHAPAAAIAFNTGPEDCADAALRWLRRPGGRPPEPVRSSSLHSTCPISAICPGLMHRLHGNAHLGTRADPGVIC
ncbi:hypothetical protein [Nocardia paucivorans]|uniref:hypothetical protein n=1 Tax=Nocardia paucivorans TaxID=114259 RepID=UPI00030C3E6E|nr:hypothetical protein [Nocardia paucivorans]